MTVNLDASAAPPRRRVWDLPVRIVHGLLIACVAGAWLTREGQLFDLHAVFGYCALGLVVFRVAWGFWGSRHSRFDSFAYSPREAFAYLAGAVRGRARHYTGHNPAGSWAVFALLALLGATALTGVIVVGALYGEGPIAATSSFALTDILLDWHVGLAWAVLGFAAFHVLGVVWGSRVHRENLAAAMVTGRKAVHDDDTGDAPLRGTVAAAVAIAVAAIGLAYLLLWSPRDTERRTRDEDLHRAALKAQAWSKECGGCHLAYSPALLPFTSWQRTIDEQDRHFGEDLGLTAAAGQRLLDHARKEAPPSWAAWKLAASAGPGKPPLEITATAFWRDAHASLPEAAFKPPVSAGRHECEACHRDAGSGIFHPRMIHMAKGRVGN
jgi:cytochrome b